MDEEIDRRLIEIERRLELIEERNRRVEAQKAWETSSYRKVAIVVLTYFVMCLVFYSVGSHSAWRNAIVPTMGFFLSTLSLPFLRERWTAKRAIRRGKAPGQ